MDYFSYLKKCFDDSDLTLTEIAEKLKDYGFNITKSYLSQLQNAKTPNPATPELNRAMAAVTGGDAEKLLMLAVIEKAPVEIKEKFKRLNVLKQIRSDVEKSDRVQEAQEGYIANDRMLQIPLLGRISAGTPIDRIENIEDIEYIDRAYLKGHRGFALRVKGNSMIGDHIADGDIVICSVQKEVSPFDIAVVAVDGETATLKRVKCQDDMCMLIPSNPQMQPQLIQSKKIEIIGKVVEVRRRFL